MKNNLFALFLLPVLAAVSAPLSYDPAKWDANPLDWRFDAAAGTLCGGSANAFAIFDAPRCAKMRLSARVTPESAGTNNWATCGVSLFHDEWNYWHVALVQAPPEAGGRRHFELCEMRGGAWLSQYQDKLVCTEQRQVRAWNYGETLDLSIESTPEGIRGEVRDATGARIWSMRYAFPAPAADGTVRAVTCGRPALHVNGGFRGVFAKLDADCAEPRPVSSAFPAYTGDIFVPDVKESATGFFRVVEKDGRWWVIDPLGRGTVLLGVDHVTYWGHHSQRAHVSHHHEVNKVKFPDKRDWEADTLGRLKAWGFNLLGAGCDQALKHRGLIHTIFLSIGDGLCGEGNDPDYYICPNEHRPCSAFPNVFHPQFAAWADYKARRQCAPNRDDPWLFGYFIDNELAWWGRGGAATGLFDAVAKLPATHSARVAQQAFLAARGVKGTPSDGDKLAFLKLAADLYFRISSEAIRRHDPNHLVMGARFAGLGGAHPAVWEVSGKYCDVVTFNCYPWADLDRNVVMTDRGGNAKRVVDAFTEQYGHVKRPMLITEWSFPALDSGLPCTGGAGQRFQTQALRTQATELFAKTMLSLPFLVGYDYFMWVDEPPEGISDAFPEDSNYGLINEKGEAYPEITSMFARLHREVGTWLRAGAPAEKPAPARAGGETAEQALARLAPAAAGKTASAVREGDRYVLRNASGLELAGRMGARYMFESVKLGGTLLGQYTGMLNDRVDGGLRWNDATKVVSAEVRTEGGRAVAVVASENRPSAGYGFRLTHRIVLPAEGTRFLCELVRAENIGEKPIDVNAFYFRQYAPYATDKNETKMKVVPNLWKAPFHDAWFARTGGAYFGGATTAPTVSMFCYHLMSNGKSQHPDAMFAPEKELVLAPGAVYDPKGTMWMVALCGLDGADGWKKAVGEATK